MEDNKELEAIVQRMIDAGEPEENIAKVIQEFNRKSAETVKTTPVAKDATAGEEIASDTESQSEIISLDTYEKYQSDPEKYTQELRDMRRDTDMVSYALRSRERKENPELYNNKGEKLKKEKEVVDEILMDKSLPREYNELNEDQLSIIENKAKSILSNPSNSEIKIKSIEIFNKAQKGIKSLEEETGARRFLEGLDKGAAYLGEAIASIPETLIDIVGLPLKGLVEIGVLPENTATTSEELKEGLGITNPVLDFFIAEEEKSTRQLDIYDKKRFKTTSPTENFANGDYYDGFVTMGNAIGESAGVSIAFTSPAQPPTRSSAATSSRRATPAPTRPSRERGGSGGGRASRPSRTCP